MAPEDLEKKVLELEALVAKQSLVLASTGKQLMELQVKDVKTRMHLLDAKQPKFDPEDYVSNEDIVQLVCELQGQLDLLETRTIRRNINAQISLDDAEKPLAPLSNKDGDVPDDYPATLAALKELSNSEVVRLCQFYELIEENEVNLELQAIVDSEHLTPEDATKLLADPQHKDAAATANELSDEEVTELFDELCRYIGVRYRRGITW